VPWVVNPYVAIYKDGVELTDDFISPDLLSSYAIRIYHNRVLTDQTLESGDEVQGSSYVAVTASAKNNLVYFDLTKRDTDNHYKKDSENNLEYLEFSLSNNGTDFSAGKALDELFSFDIKYTLLSGEIITKTLTKEIGFCHPLPYYEEPEIILFCPSEGDEVDASSYTFKDLPTADGAGYISGLTDVKIRVYPHVDEQ
jgi:hypothetical protein